MSRGRWRKIQGVVRALRPWVDPKSNRPRVLLLVVSLGVFLWPLAVDVAYARFFRLPRWFRVGGALLAAAWLGRRCRSGGLSCC